MRGYQLFVRDFHEKFDITVGDEKNPAIVDVDLRCRLIEEEAKEACDAIRSGNLSEAVHELVDLLYVTLGAGVTFGVDLLSMFMEVHRANMRKSIENKREDGKILKGEEYVKPHIEKKLRENIKKAKKQNLMSP